MSSLANKRILLGVSGGIAAYKSADLVRRLQDAGASVRVAMTKAAQEFITPLTMQALSGHQVHLDLLDPEAEAGMGHIELARWADVVIIAPATADIIAQLANGEAGSLLTATCLASAAPIVIAPAMNQGMWRKESTQHNLRTLQARNFTILGPAEGSQACGDVGPGRMLEPATIIAGLEPLFATGSLAGRKVVISAGPTREAVDPVRYISNHSSGKMGYALAMAAAEAGARTVLVSGPTNLAPPERVTTRQVTSAAQMLAACLEEIVDCDIFIAAAAVADYRPKTVAKQKIKKDTDIMHIEMEKNPDIVATIAALDNKPFTVGFAAETNNILEHARGKLARKNLDAIIANDVSRDDIGFNSDDNQVFFITRHSEEELPLLGKNQLARILIQKLAEA
ncbi:MAG: bifunctional phosphopantothenoylcysteine decarboxylase/phosphopantothenate--cysteine ligase CoaBC [Porticoccaceae bacterium]